MLSYTRIGMGLGVVAAIGSMIALIGGGLPLLWRIITVALLIISICSIVKILDRKKMRQQERLIQAAHQQAVQLINHKRHDWMNDLQLLYGYVRMNKIEQLPVYVERLKQQAIGESRIAKLGCPELILYLLQQKLAGGMMPVEVNVQEMLDLSKLRMSLNSAQLTTLIIRGVQIFRVAPKMNDGYEAMEPLMLSIAQEEGQLLICYGYEGKLLRPDDVKIQLEKTATEHGVRLKQLFNMEQSAGKTAYVYQWSLPCRSE